MPTFGDLLGDPGKRLLAQKGFELGADTRTQRSVNFITDRGLAIPAVQFLTMSRKKKPQDHGDGDELVTRAGETSRRVTTPNWKLSQKIQAEKEKSKKKMKLKIVDNAGLPQKTRKELSRAFAQAAKSHGKRLHNPVVQIDEIKARPAIEASPGVEASPAVEAAYKVSIHLHGAKARENEADSQETHSSLRLAFNAAVKTALHHKTGKGIAKRKKAVAVRENKRDVPAEDAFSAGDPRRGRVVEDEIVESAGIKIRHLPVGRGEDEGKIAVFAALAL